MIVLQPPFNRFVTADTGDVMTAQASGSAIPTHKVVSAVDERSAQGIAAAVHRLIRGEQIGIGDRLPTVRDLAKALGVSPATVQESWRALGAVGAIEARGRAGTFVTRSQFTGVPARYLGLGSGPALADDGALDLSRGTPDPALLPPLHEAFERITANAASTAWTTSYLDDPVLPPLRDFLMESWPFHTDMVTVVDGALDALSRLVDALVGFGDRVVMESPGFPPLIDLLERAGAEVVSIEMDEQGMCPDAVQESLRLSPVAVFVQPRAQNPTGTSMTRLRASQLAEVLRTTSAWIIEDDHCGEISVAEDVSIGQFLPDRCIHIRSYSKSHGPDLRIAAVGGPASVIEALIARRMLGPGWTSRILQAALLDLLTHVDSAVIVGAARDAYARRGAMFREGLRDRGVVPSPGDGINVWVPVEDERAALINLAAAGVRVAPGYPFLVAGGSGIRITTGRLPDDPARVEQVADIVARASGTFPIRGR